MADFTFVNYYILFVLSFCFFVVIYFGIDKCYCCSQNICGYETLHFQSSVHKGWIYPCAVYVSAQAYIGSILYLLASVNGSQLLRTCRNRRTGIKNLPNISILLPRNKNRVRRRINRCKNMAPVKWQGGGG